MAAAYKHDRAAAFAEAFFYHFFCKLKTGTFAFWPEETLVCVE